VFDAAELLLYENGLTVTGSPLKGRDLQVRVQTYSCFGTRPLTWIERLERGECALLCHDEPAPECRVYWGSHGCARLRGHDGEHVCDCGALPYEGAATRFFGEDAPDFDSRPIAEVTTILPS
jgi:hypothetical protein